MKSRQRTLTIQTKTEMRHYSQKVWKLLQETYQKVEGGLHFNSIEDLINSTIQWKVVLFGEKVIAVTVYKAKNGMKITAFAACKNSREISIPALVNLLKKELKKCWIEVSEKAEEFILKYCGIKFIMSNTTVKNVLNKSIELCDDGIHYMRTIQNIKKQKLLLGTLQLETNI